MENGQSVAVDRETMRNVVSLAVDHVDGGGKLEELDPVELVERAGTPEQGRSVRGFMRRIGEGATLASLKGITPRELSALYATSRSLLESGCDEKAHELLQFLCMHDHFNGDYWLGFGIAQTRLKRHSHALRSFAMGAMVTSDDPRFPLHCAEIHLRLGNAEEARSGANMAVDLARGTKHEKIVAHRAESVFLALSKSDAKGTVQ